MQKIPDQFFLKPFAIFPCRVPLERTVKLVLQVLLDLL